MAASLPGSRYRAFDANGTVFGNDKAKDGMKSSVMIGWKTFLMF